ncbi:O-antigen ligase domain-containing protein, partial [Bacillus pacificus]|nr:O-antigen ligase domain-containing protein [Bacillus pacificus]
MKIQAKKTIQLLFYMSILSIFIINSNVYPIIFGLFIVGASIIFLYNHEYKIKKWTLVILGFLLWSVIVFI